MGSILKIALVVGCASLLYLLLSQRVQSVLMVLRRQQSVNCSHSYEAIYPPGSTWRVLPPTNATQTKRVVFTRQPFHELFDQHTKTQEDVSRQIEYLTGISADVIIDYSQLATVPQRLGIHPSCVHKVCCTYHVTNLVDYCDQFKEVWNATLWGPCDTEIR